MKQILIFLTILAVGFLLSYLTIGFLGANFDFTQWSDQQRVNTILLNFVFSFLLLGVYAGNLE
jgi:hypothetical protein